MLRGINFVSKNFIVLVMNYFLSLKITFEPWSKEPLSSSLACSYRLPVWPLYSIVLVRSVWTIFYYMFQSKLSIQSTRWMVFSFNSLANLIREKTLICSCIAPSYSVSSKRTHTRFSRILDLFVILYDFKNS